MPLQQVRVTVFRYNKICLIQKKWVWLTLILNAECIFFHKNLLTGHPKNMVISKVSFCKKYFLIQYTPQYALRCVLVHCLRYVAINIRRLLPHMFTCLLVSWLPTLKYCSVIQNAQLSPLMQEKKITISNRVKVINKIFLQHILHHTVERPVWLAVEWCAKGGGGCYYQ